MKRQLILTRPGGWEGWHLAAGVGFAALLFFSISPHLLEAMHVRVRDGQEVRLSLRNILTTENVEKDDVIQFEVAEDVVVNGHAVIAKGAPATGKVVKVKPLGRKKSKDAAVTFRFVTVTTVDKQQVPVRKHPSEDKKKGEKENGFEESNPIPGMVERVIGAEKGKVYIAYLDEAVVVNAPDTPATVQPAPSTGSTAATSTAAQAVQMPAASPPEPAIVDFRTDPSGADIMLDGNFAGNTPSSLQVAPGRHTIELRLNGYRSFTRSIKIDEGSHPSVSTTLEKE